MHESAVVVEDTYDDGNDTEEHDDTLNKVVDHRSHISAQDNIDTSKCSHYDDADFIVDVKCHVKESGQTVID